MLARSVILGLGWSALALLPMRATDLPEQKLPVYGGSGGAAFSRSCGDGRVITGFRYREGMLVDAIGLLCRTVNADGSLGTESTYGTLAGGGGGTSGSISCPSGSVLGGVRVAHGTYVDGIRLLCRAWARSTRSMGADTWGSDIDVGNVTLRPGSTERCESVLQPAVAIRGRENTVVDAFGLICDEP